MGLREKKKEATRIAISDVATELFLARGFDAVTVADVAAAANVSTMTVFNYFERKEDLLFDRDTEALGLLDDALGRRGAKEPALSALRRAMRGLLAARHPFAKMDEGVSTFWRTVEESSVLLARTRELASTAEDHLARRLAVAAGQETHDPTARMLASSLVGGWRAAYGEALRLQRKGAKKAAVDAALASWLERAFTMTLAAARGTPYA